MIRAYFSILSILFVCTALQSQSFWKSVDSDQIHLKQNQEQTILPDAYSSFALENSALKIYLQKAPTNKNFSKQKSFFLDIPMPDGSLQRFQIFESSVMEEGLQRKYPNIRSFKGVSTIDKRTNIRFDYSLKGFHGAIHSLDGSIYIDPIASNQTAHYISYYTKDHKPDTDGLQLSCGTLDKKTSGSFEQDLTTTLKDEELNVKNFEGGDSVKMQVYKLAISCTGEWAQTQGGTVEGTLASINTSVNRLNQVFENELSIRMVLVDRNDELIWLDGETDPWDNPLLGTTDSDNFPDQIGLREANVNIINGIIGSSNYDIGHCYTIGSCYSPGSATRFGLAGIAEFESVCTNALKARGVTCFYNNNIDNITINVVAHEMGHQMNATHTFNNCNGSAFVTPYEPGSGSTIMSYAGACGSNNVQGNADDYFHVANIQQIYSYLRDGNGNTCPDIDNTFNTEPSIELNFTNDFYIPISTPFELSGKASDLEGDELTYAWEQMDNGTSSSLGDPQDTAPSFRSMRPSDSPTRFFPRVSRLISNSSDRTEVLPSYSRDFNFRFVVRDNHFLGGTTVWDEMSFKATEEAGPFVITNHNSFEDLTIGEPIELTWDVANTDGELVNCKNVDIFLSSDGGYNFDQLLVKGTPNDGSYEFFVPNFPSFQTRFKVIASDNIFFDITNANTRIVEPTDPSFIVDAVSESSIICLPDEAVVNFTTAGFAGFDENLSFEIVSQLPEGTTYTFSKNDIEASETNQLIINFPASLAEQQIEVDVEIIGGELAAKIRKVNFQLISNDFSDLEMISPISGSEDIGSLPSFSWTTSVAADAYQFELSTSPAFGESNIVTTRNIEDTIYTSPELLEKSTLYYWRVSGMNTCGVRVFGPIQTFHTEVQSCKSYGKDDLDVRITQSGTPTIEYDVNVVDAGSVKDLNINKLKGLHDQISDLKVSLLSPMGTEVILFENKCGNLTNYDLGFDDAAANDVRCPLTGGAIYKSKQALSIFNEEEVTGEWTIRLDDQKPGNGGNLKVFTFEVCSNAVPDKPILIRNNRLELAAGETEIISDENISVEDPNNSASELFFTLVTQVAVGELSLNGQKLEVGDMFTQQDIYDGSLVYSHDNGEAEADGFYFIVIDGEGGWIDQKWFEIFIDTGSSTAVEDLQIANNQLKVFPNPASQIVNIIFETEQAEKMSIQLFDMQGKLIFEKIDFSNNNSQLSLRHFSEGLYIIRVNTEKEFAIRKLVINQ